jgi:hypothetical protein
LGKPERLTYLGLQGKSNSDAFVKGFFIKYSMDGISWDFYGDIPPARYYVCIYCAVISNQPFHKYIVLVGWFPP